MAARPQLSRFYYPDWEAEYRAALTETDTEKFREKIRLAGIAMFNRSLSIRPEAADERNAMAEATLVLRALINKRLKPSKASSFPSNSRPGNRCLAHRVICSARMADSYLKSFL